MSSSKTLTKHHVPPKCPDEHPRFLRAKRAKHYKAYELLFGKVKTLEGALRKLKTEWWEPTKTDSKDLPIVMKPMNEHQAYNMLFRNAKSYEDAAEIFIHDWWPQEKG